ncbi:MAG: HEAT repeat domain-containing protein [Proteobacteria bacterium]|nr:HEAT repeat domain-containing protein [Pseudomonadota bacterium]
MQNYSSLISDYILRMEQWAAESTQPITPKDCLAYLIKDFEEKRTNEKNHLLKPGIFYQERRKYISFCHDNPVNQDFKFDQFFNNLDQYTEAKVSVIELEKDHFCARIVAWLYCFEPDLRSLSINIPEKFETALINYQVNQLANYLKQSNLEICRAACYAIEQFVTCRRLTSTQLNIWRAPLMRLLGYAPTQKSTIKTLGQIFSYQDITPDWQKDLINLYIKLLNDRAPTIRETACLMLDFILDHKNLAQQFTVLLDKLIPVLNDRDQTVRTAANQAVSRIIADPEFSIEQLRERLKDLKFSFPAHNIKPDDHITAYRTLRQLMAHPRLSSEELGSWLNDLYYNYTEAKSDSVCAELRVVLGQIVAHPHFNPKYLERLWYTLAKPLNQGSTINKKSALALGRIAAHQSLPFFRKLVHVWYGLIVADICEETLMLVSQVLDYHQDSEGALLAALIREKLIAYCLFIISDSKSANRDNLLAAACKVLGQIVVRPNLSPENFNQFLTLHFIKQNYTDDKLTPVSSLVSQIAVHPHLSPKQFKLLMDNLTPFLNSQFKSLSIFACLTLSQVATSPYFMVKEITKPLTALLEHKDNQVRTVACQAWCQIAILHPEIYNSDPEFLNKVGKFLKNFNDEDLLKISQVLTHFPNICNKALIINTQCSTRIKIIFNFGFKLALMKGIYVKRIVQNYLPPTALCDMVLGYYR